MAAFAAPVATAALEAAVIASFASFGPALTVVGGVTAAGVAAWKAVAWWKASTAAAAAKLTAVTEAAAAAVAAEAAAAAKAAEVDAEKLVEKASAAAPSVPWVVGIGIIVVVVAGGSYYLVSLPI